MSDPVRHPQHYSAQGPVPGVECIEITQWFNFNLGNVIKYVWRHGAKGNPVQDLQKARAYLDFEIARLSDDDPFAHLPIPDEQLPLPELDYEQIPVPSFDDPHATVAGELHPPVLPGTNFAYGRHVTKLSLDGSLVSTP